MQPDKTFRTNQKLGIEYSPVHTQFSLWAPDAHFAYVAIYEKWSDVRHQRHQMEKDGEGVWKATIQGDLDGKFYLFLLERDGSLRQALDPYSVSCAPNSRKSAIIDLKRSNPKGFESHTRPKLPPNEAILYELSVRDMSSMAGSGFLHPGTFSGLYENSSWEGTPVGLDHLKDLGITHIHLMPVMDFATVDELDPKEYNWGYDPVLWNVPEGSYSLDPNDPYSRVRELKQLVMEAHRKGLGVVLDVVYNHTYFTGSSHLETIYPGYYYRKRNDGSFSDGSGCGNEIDTKAPMAARLILDSLKYLLEEYRLDGFRFDLMGLMDVKLAETIKSELSKINPNVIIYGEPWTGGDSTLYENERMLRGRQKGKGISLFNDQFRNAIKGDNDSEGKGFVQGDFQQVHEIIKGLVGGIDYKEYKGFCQNPKESISYFNAHDNLIMQDKLKISVKKPNPDKLGSITLMAFALILTSFGIPFFHEGNEFMRDKELNHNSYNAPDSINQVDWSLAKENIGILNSVKELIKIRKDFEPFRNYDSADILKSFKYEIPQDGVLKYSIRNKSAKSGFRTLTVFINTTDNEYYAVSKLHRRCKVLMSGSEVSSKGIENYQMGNRVLVKANSVLIIGS